MNDLNYEQPDSAEETEDLDQDQEGDFDENELGEEYEEESERDGDEYEDTEREDTQDEEDKESDDEEAKEKITRTPEQTRELAAEFYGVPKDQVIVDKQGKPKLVMKINGRKKLVDPHDMPKGFNLNQAGYEKLNQGKMIEKQHKAFWDQAKQDPMVLIEALKKMGHDPRSISQKILQDAVDEHEMTPEERERKELEERVQKYEAEKKQREEQERNNALTQQREQARQTYTQDLTKAMVAEGFKESTVQVKGNIMMSAVQKMMYANQGGRDLSAADAVKIAKQEWQDNVLGTFNDIDENQIISILPDNIIKAIRKADLKRLRGGTPAPTEDDIDQSLELEDYEEDHQPKRMKKKMSMNEWFNNLT